MIREEICTGKSIEEAIEAACAKLGVNQDDRNVSVEVLEMPVRKLFRTIPAKAKVTVEVEDPTPPPPPIFTADVCLRDPGMSGGIGVVYKRQR